MFDWQDAWQAPYNDVALTGNHLALVYWSILATHAQSPLLSEIIEDSRTNRDRYYGQPRGFHAALETAILEYAASRARLKPMGLEPEDAMQCGRSAIAQRYDRFDPLQVPLPHHLARFRRSIQLHGQTDRRYVSKGQVLREIQFRLQYSVIGRSVQQELLTSGLSSGIPSKSQHEKQYKTQSKIAEECLERLVPHLEEIIDWLSQRSRGSRQTVAEMVEASLTLENLTHLIADWHHLEIKTKGWIGHVVRNAIIDELRKQDNLSTTPIEGNQADPISYLISYPISSDNIAGEIYLLLPTLIPYIRITDKIPYLALVVLRNYGWKCDEIGKCLGISAVKAHRIQHHGNKALAERVAELYDLLRTRGVVNPGFMDVVRLLEEMDSCQNLYQWRLQQKNPTEWTKFIRFFARILEDPAFQCSTWFTDLQDYYSRAASSLMPWQELIRETIRRTS